MVCLECDSSYVKACGIAQSRRCTYCAEIKRGDVAAVGRSGWEDRPQALGVWLTLTAPGQDVLPFDSTQCSHTPGIACSGALGCVCAPLPLALWHARLPGNWTHFVTDLRRLLNKGCSGPPSSWPVTVQFFKTYEPQKRLALHAHAMLRVHGVISERRFQAACRLAARRNGFGSQVKAVAVDLGNEATAARVAGYCAKYAAKSADRLPDVRRIDGVTGEITTGGMRAWSSSREWGASMSLVRQRRITWNTSAGTAPALGSLQPSSAVTAPALTCSPKSTQIPSGEPPGRITDATDLL